MWLSRHRVAILLWVAVLAIIGSMVVKSEAALLFLVAFLAAFAAGIYYSVGLYKRGYL